MHRLFILILALVAAIPAAGGAEGFPCTAYVAVERAEIVAGPGQRFYTTQHLTRGKQIEIYREEPSGWLAIRPPEGSFSWMPAQYIEEVEEGVGRVKQATGAWIGTAVEVVSEHRQEVTLKPGEIVDILGERKVAGPDGKEQRWFKIAPPAGEFRWIHVRDVSRQQPPPLAIPVAANDAAERADEAEADAEEAEEDRPRTSKEPQRIELAGNEIPLKEIRPAAGFGGVERAQFTTSSGGKSATSLSPDGFVARKRREGEPQPIDRGSIDTIATRGVAFSPGRIDSAPRIAANTRPDERLERGTSVSTSAAASTGISADQIARQLDQIEVDLSLMLAQDKSLWDIASLQKRIERLVNEGSDPLSRGRARLVLEKLRQIETAFNVEDYGVIARSAGEVSGNGTNSGGTESASETRYDAQGWLKPVVSRQSNKAVAPFAVVDQDGQPVCFITPSPGLNLQRYVNKPVGLYGRRGYLEQLKKPHLTAERVIELDRQWR